MIMHWPAAVMFSVLFLSIAIMVVVTWGDK